MTAVFFDTLNENMEFEFRIFQIFHHLKFRFYPKIPKLPKNKTFMEYIDSDECPFMDTKERGNYRVIQVLMQMYNFKVKIRRGKIWGALQKDGFWIGVVGSLNRSEIDLSISSLRWENDRYDVLDQTTDTFYIK